jgi:hypothetical protein
MNKVMIEITGPRTMQKTHKWNIETDNMHQRAGSSTPMLFRALGQFRSWVFILSSSSLLYQKNQTCHRSDMSLGLNWALRLIPHGSWGLSPGVTHRCVFILTLLPSMWLSHNLSQNNMILGEGAEHQCLCVMCFLRLLFSQAHVTKWPQML